MMDFDTPSSVAAFNKLPIELNKHILGYIDDDIGVCSFSLTCRATRAAVNGDFGSFWRSKFRAKYAFKEGTPNHVLKFKYQDRAYRLRHGTSVKFSYGDSKKEMGVLNMLKELITESFQGTTHGFDDIGRPQCVNHIVLIRFILSSKLFVGIKRLPCPGSTERKTTNPLLHAIQLLLAQFLFTLDGFKHDILSFDDSQRYVYAKAAHVPMYLGFNKTEVNLEWAMHCLNFFRSHMQVEQTSNMYQVMESLEGSQKPSPWLTHLEDNGCYPLATNWKGTYAFLEIEDLVRIRASIGLPGNRKGTKDVTQIFMDQNVDQGNIQSLTLEFVDPSKKFTWPAVFEDRLDSLRQASSPRTRAQHRTKPSEHESRSIQFKGEGEDDDSFFAKGWLNPLPPQCDIPGWQRVTFMKYFVSENQVEMDALWAYEGVVLPGGRMILGRWWYASEDPDDRSHPENSGPFIFWAVDAEPDFEDMSEEED